MVEIYERVKLIFRLDTLTLVVDTGFRRRTVLIASTSQNAHSVNASLISLTLCMSNTRYHTLTIHTLFTSRAVGNRSTNSYNNQHLPQ